MTAAYFLEYHRQLAWKSERNTLSGSAANSCIAEQISHARQDGDTATPPATFKPASRNNRMARGRWVRWLTSSTERKPLKRNNRAVSRAFSKVLCDKGSISRAASGTPPPSAFSRMYSASGTGPVPPPESTSNGAAPSRYSWIARSTRRASAEPRQPRTTIASADRADGRRSEHLSAIDGDVLTSHPAGEGRT